MAKMTEGQWADFEFATEHKDHSTALEILAQMDQSYDVGKAIQVAKMHNNQTVRTAAEDKFCGL